MTTIEKEIQELKAKVAQLEKAQEVLKQMLDEFISSKNQSPTEIRQIAEINVYTSKRQRAAEVYRNRKGGQDNEN